jgi:RNA polymerase sigma-70 factor, ECF subfamily
MVRAWAKEDVEISEELDSQAPRGSYLQLNAEELIETCVTSADAAAWQEFMRRYHRLIAGVVYRTTQQWGEAHAATVDDLIQETYLKLCADGFRLLRSYDPKHPDAIYGYLKVIAANIVHDRFKALHSEKRGGHLKVEDLNVVESRTGASEGFGSQSAMERGILLDEIDTILKAGLSQDTADRDRTIFWLYYRQGLTTRAISNLPALGLTNKGVESTIFRLTRMVRKKMVDTRLGNLEPNEGLATGKS